MSALSFKQRIGIDTGRALAVEDALAWAGENGLRFLQVETDSAPNALESFDAARAEGVRALCEQHGVSLGLHTLSAVNIAEYSPFVRDAVDAYLRGYVDVAKRLGAGWIVVHGGYHFGDKAKRMQASRERLARAADYAAEAGVRLLLENLNAEPDEAEVHYFLYDLEECHYWFDHIDSAWLGWAFTINHAHMVAEGIDGFIDGLGVARLGEVRLADNLGDREVHLYPGEGNIDFRHVFSRLEGLGYRGHYMNNFGSPEEMLRGREVLAAMGPSEPG